MNYTTANQSNKINILDDKIEIIHYVNRNEEYRDVRFINLENFGLRAIKNSGPETIFVTHDVHRNRLDIVEIGSDTGLLNPMLIAPGTTYLPPITMIGDTYVDAEWDGEMWMYRRSFNAGSWIVTMGDGIINTNQ